MNETSCIPWWGPIPPSTGYGRVYLSRRKYLMAHRVVYESLVGPIPEGMHIDHLCRNPRCVNPQHLAVVTRTENVMRGDSPPAQNARKTHCKHGHLFDLFNTYIDKRGRRACNVCRERVSRARWATHFTEPSRAAAALKEEP